MPRAVGSGQNVLSCDGSRAKPCRTTTSCPTTLYDSTVRAYNHCLELSSDSGSVLSCGMQLWRVQKSQSMFKSPLYRSLFRSSGGSLQRNLIADPFPLPGSRGKQRPHTMVGAVYAYVNGLLHKNPGQELASLTEPSRFVHPSLQSECVRPNQR